MGQVAEDCDGNDDLLGTHDWVGQGEGQEEWLEGFERCYGRHSNTRDSIRTEHATDPIGDGVRYFLLHDFCSSRSEEALSVQ